MAFLALISTYHQYYHKSGRDLALFKFAQAGERTWDLLAFPPSYSIPPECEVFLGARER